MQNNNITKLALKMAGIYILVQSIMYLPAIVSSIKMLNLSDPINETKMVTITLLITFALLIVTGLLLTFLNRPKFEKSKIASKELLTTGIAVGGIIIFAFAINNLPSSIAHLVYTLTSSKGMIFLALNSDISSIMTLTGILIQLLLGALLFFKAKYFTRLIK
jgi:hypothetical protein